MTTRGRPCVGKADKIVNFAEYTAEKKYKQGLEDLEMKTGKSKHLHFREALRQYCEKYNAEYFIEQKKMQIAREEMEIAEMQARIKDRERVSMEIARCELYSLLGYKYMIGEKITEDVNQRIARDIANAHQLQVSDMLKIINSIQLDFGRKSLLDEKDPIRRQGESYPSLEWPSLKSE